MEQAPKRRLIIRKKLVPKEGDESSSCTFNPITDTLKKCPCGGNYTSDSEYTPRECCSGLYTHGVRYNWVDGRYTPDYTPAEVVGEKQKFYSGFEKPVIYDFSGDKFISTTANTPAKETTSGFNIMPASKLRETQRGDSREDKRDYREDKRDYREESRNTSRYSREDTREYREDTRDSRDIRNTSRNIREDKRDRREDKRDYREDTRDSRNTSRYSREDSRDSRNTSRYSREDTRDSRNDRDYHRSRERDYARNTRVTDEPNRYNGARREPSKFKSDLDSELSKYGRKF